MPTGPRLQSKDLIFTAAPAMEPIEEPIGEMEKSWKNKPMAM